MAYRQAIFANNQFYHVYNRGVEKRATFMNKRDYSRFTQSFDYYRNKNQTIRFSFRNRPMLLKKDISSGNSFLVEIVSFCLMPNHFHLLLKQAADEGITKFLSKLSNSYTKYFNTKYQRVGPLFQGSFKAVRMESDEQLIHTCRYIHLNPLIDYLVKDLRAYPYSSYPEYLGLKNEFCQKESGMGSFSSPEEYEKFVLDQEDYGRSIKLIERTILEEAS